MNKNDFLKEYYEYAKELTDAPFIFHSFVGLSILSTTISNTAYMLLGNSKIYANLWIVLIAPSSEYRKSTAINIGKSFLEQEDRIINSFSYEALLSNLQNKAQGCFFYDEFTTLLGLLSRDYNAGTKSILTEFYDSPKRYERETKTQKIEINDIFINFLCATTKDWFVRNTKEADLMAGFLPRFLFVPAHFKEKNIPIPSAFDYNEKFRITQILRVFKNVPENQLILSKESETLYKHFYTQFRRFENPLLDAFFSRLKIYCFKFAMLHQININIESKIIDIKAMSAAISLANWCASSLLKLYGEELSFTTFQENVIKVTKIIKKGEITRDKLLSLSRLPIKELENVLSYLFQSNKAEIKIDENKIKTYKLKEGIL